MPIFYDAKRGAELLGISVSMYYRLVREGTVPSPHKIGNRSLWLYKDLEGAAHSIPQSTKGAEK